MKVLLKVCRRCGFVQFYSVEILCQSGAPAQIGPVCPACGDPQGVTATATEIDQPEVGEPIDEQAIADRIARYVT